MPCGVGCGPGSIAPFDSRALLHRFHSPLAFHPRRRPIKPAAIKVLIVDDEPILRRGLALLVGEDEDIEVVGEAAGSDEAMRLIEQADPDVVVTELLPGVAWFEFIAQMAERGRPLVLVISHADEMIYGPRTLRLGARGYLLKTESPDALIQAVHRIAAGEVAISERLASRLMKEMVLGEPSNDPSSIGRLTTRQLEVFELIGQSWSTREIAERLNLSIKTVNVYRAKIKAKLSLDTTTKLSQLAVEWVERQKRARATS